LVGSLVPIIADLSDGTFIIVIIVVDDVACPPIVKPRGFLGTSRPSGRMYLLLTRRHFGEQTPNYILFI